MLRVLGAMGVAVAVFAGSAQAANSPLVVWQGSVTITNLSNQCSVGYTVGDLATSIYRPRLNPDEPPSAVTMFSSRSAQIFFNANTSTNDQMIGKGNYNGHYIGPRATTVPNSSQGAFTGNYSFKIKPAAITEDTTSITITGTVTNFFNQTGCRVDFVGAYQPRGN